MTLFSLTPAQLAANNIDSIGINTFQFLVNSYMNAFDQLWNPNGYATADVLAAWGTGATARFVTSAATRDFIQAQDPGVLPSNYLTPLQPVTFNQDGTVVLTGG